MYRAQPIFNRLCVDKEMERKREIHRQKINNIQSTFRQKTPQNYSVDYKLSRLKREQQHESRYTEIERENRILLEKITHIMGKNTIQLNNRPGSPKSLNIQNRKRFVSKVQEDNYQFLKRLQDQRSNYSVRQWESDFQKNQEMVQKISQYPINLFQTPKDGSIMQQHNQSIQQPFKMQNQGFININGNTSVNNSNNYSPERISYQNQQQQRPNTSQVRSSSNKYPVTSQNFYSQNNTIQQQNSSQKQQRSSSPKPFNRNNVSSVQDDRQSDQPNYSNILQQNNSSFERSQDYQRDRMPVINSNPSSTKHSKNPNLANGNRNTTFYSGNIKSLGSRDHPSRRNGRAKSNSQSGTSQKRKKLAIDSINNNNNSFSPDRQQSPNGNNTNASAFLYPPNESTAILYKKPKKISGEFFQLEIRLQDKHLIILAEHLENQELKIIEIPEEEAQEFIKEECDSDINSLALRLRLHNGKLYLIGTKALQNSNKKTSTSPIQTSSDNQEYLNQQIQLTATEENQQDQNEIPQQSIIKSYQQDKNQQKSNRNIQEDSSFFNQDKGNGFQPVNNIQPNSIHDKHEEFPPMKLKK